MIPDIPLATAADAERLRSFAAEAFHDTYESHNTPADMERYVADAFTVERQTAEITGADSTVLLAEHSEESGFVHVVGYAHLIRSAPPPAVGPAPIELKRFYVGRKWHGQGIAQALMDATLDAARMGGARTIWLGVWEVNRRAIAFYTKSGFVPLGELSFMLGAGLQRHWWMAVALRKAAVGR